LGDYLQAGFAWTTDDCGATTNLGVPGFPETIITQTENADGTITGTSSSTGLTYICTLDGMDVSCAPALFSSTAVPSTDATLNVYVSAEGMYSDETNYTADVTLTVECDGDACVGVAVGWGIKDFPCSSVGSTSASYVATTK
jgi:hypothetical protein